MRTSSLKGVCLVCDHFMTNHTRATCIARGCKEKIVVYGVTSHYLLLPEGGSCNRNGDVVCQQCPYHGRVSRIEDFTQSPVVAKGEDGNLYLVEEGVEKK
ncbi:hypothetical protein BGZ63DRAFT_377314 [Mariannaea sp. PMI_226]|nr:hypothetical protein BGZ63DRAFT_377314 [Mariannaea sp. PMI_226]